MGNTYMAVLVTLSEEQRLRAGQRAEQDAVRAEVWSRAADKLQEALGKTCSQFMPASRPWDLPALPLYGVLLGTAEPLDFIRCFGRSGTMQQAEVRQRSRPMLEMGEKLISATIAEGVELTAVAVPKDDPEVERFMELGHAFLKGDIAAGAGIYYLEQNANFMDESYDRYVLANLYRYALCVAELTPVKEA